MTAFIPQEPERAAPAVARDNLEELLDNLETIIGRPDFTPIIDIENTLNRQTRQTGRRRPPPPNSPEVNMFTGRIYRKRSPQAAVIQRVIAKHEKYIRGIQQVIKNNRNMVGRSFGYRVNQELKLGTCSVYGVDIAQLCTESGILSWLYLPKKGDVPDDQLAKLLNLTRLFFRRLGFMAKRCKELTILEANNFVQVLEQGEKWEVPLEFVPIIFTDKKKDWEQLPLISKSIYDRCEHEHNVAKYEKDLINAKQSSRHFYPSGTTGSGYPGTTTGTSGIYTNGATVGRIFGTAASTTSTYTFRSS